MSQYNISDEQLDSLLSDCITRDSIEIIVNAVRSGEENTDEVKIKLQLLRRLYRWSEYTHEEPDSPSYCTWKQHEREFVSYENKIARIQKELVPNLIPEVYNENKHKTIEESME